MSAIILLWALATAPDTPDIALWLARSCVGEADWDSGETGECLAIAHIYKKRADISGMSFYKVMRKYSAALKTNHRPWIRELDRSGKRPKSFPRHLVWSRYLERWTSIVAVSDAFVNGTTTDPLPSALHYGCHLDRFNLDSRYWRMMTTPYRNYFYERR